MVPRVGVLVHRRERVGPQSGARTAETRGVHGRMVVGRWASTGLGPPLIEVVRRGVVVLAVSCCSCRRPDGVVRHPRVLLQLYESGLVDAGDAAPGVRRRRAVRRRRRVLVRRRGQSATTRQVVVVIVMVTRVV